MDEGVKYTNAMQGEDTCIKPHNLTDDGLALAPGQRCVVTQGNNTVMLDRVLIESALRVMDMEASRVTT